MNIQKNKGRVLVALSGGVDSSVALYLLQEQGYQVIGAHMKLWDFSEVGGEMKKDGRCCSIEAIDDCRAICNKIGVPFYVLNFVDRFRREVIENFVSEYRAGRTPNPCIICNTRLKWESFLKRALELGCDYMATGHYSSIRTHPRTGRYYVEPGCDRSRDQSYALWGLTQEALARTLLPLGEIPKSRVRELARQHEVRTAEKPESREICFVTDDNYRRFLREWEARRGADFTGGEIVDESGETVGRHDGVEFYTIGQRKGLGVFRPDPTYVKSIDPVTHQITVSDGGALLENEFEVGGVNWMAIEEPRESIEAQVKIRYLSQAAAATITPVSAGRVSIRLHEKQRALTPGQSAVFYRDNMTLGGGVIDRVSSRRQKPVFDSKIDSKIDSELVK
ncbi:MAG: tRNA 2-thiouridine(34) synthase MnmA [candidate division Zixibacteria bacterium]|nr:tRNA 2-thiouridine(34) synthase MnmA [candidate division Zixibacteria bacterium]